MFTVLSCLHGQHDLRLVALAAMICVAAVVSAFAFYRRAQRGSLAFRATWLCLTSLIGGSGVWATHFIAMLAYEPKLNIHFDVGVTALSWLVAVVGVGAGFGLAGWLRSLAARAAGGAIVGLGVGAMHFLGMSAVRMQAIVIWRPEFVIAALVLGVVFAAAALAANVDHRTAARRLVPPALLVLAIVGLHFTAMAAAVLLPTHAAPLAAALMGRGMLADIVAGLMSTIYFGAVGVLWVERFSQEAAMKGVRASLNALPCGVAFFDREDRLQVRNSAFQHIVATVGMKLTSGMPLSDLLVRADAAGCLPSGAAGQPDLRVTIEAAAMQTAMWESELADGRWMKLEARSTPDGGLALILTDTTATNVNAKALADARDQAQAANHAKSEFLANMSHEIRTPLNGVLGIAEALSHTDLDDSQAQMLGIIRESGSTLNALLGEILDLARVESGEVTLSAEAVRVADLCDSVAALFASAARKKGLTLETRIEPAADVSVLADPLRLRQILTNLVSNAVKFTETGGVTLSARLAGPKLRLEVIDTGVGFDLAMKERLFQRFGQADSSATRTHGGAGLGLSLSKRLATLMGAELDCASAPGVGATFWLEAEFPFLAATPLEEPVAAFALIDDQPAKVLVVDDNPVNRKVLELILESVGLEHAAAENGRDALDLVRSSPFDAVLMDIQMPVMDGLEATRRIRTWETETGRAPMPIHIVSANCLPEHLAASRDAGADSHIAKPVSAAKVLSALTGEAAQAA